MRVLPVLISILVAAVVSSCSDRTSPVRPGTSTSAGPAAHLLIGSRWLLTEVTTGTGSLAVAEPLQATWQFTADHQFLASDTVNAISGGYRVTPAGFATINAGTTLVGYAGSDPVRSAVIAAFQAMTSGPVDVAPTASPTSVTMRVPGYTMTFRRAGPAETFPPAASTTSASP